MRYLSIMKKILRRIKPKVVHRMSVEDAEIVANIERCEIAIKVLQSLSTFGADVVTIGLCVKGLDHLLQKLRVALRERLQ